MDGGSCEDIRKRYYAGCTDPVCGYVDIATSTGNGRQ